MKRLLLRVDELHARLTERAKRERRSVNAIANEMLDMIGADNRHSEREHLRARAAALGILAPPLGPTDGAVDLDELRGRAIESMRGAGQIVDDILDRDRL